MSQSAVTKIIIALVIGLIIGGLAGYIIAENTEPQVSVSSLESSDIVMEMNEEAFEVLQTGSLTELIQRSNRESQLAATVAVTRPVPEGMDDPQAILGLGGAIDFFKKLFGGDGVSISDRCRVSLNPFDNRATIRCSINRAPRRSIDRVPRQPTF